MPLYLIFRKWGVWSVLSLSIALITLLPILLVFAELRHPISNNWQHIVRYLLTEYVKNTLVLSVSVISVSGIIGITAAWLVTQFEFTGRAWISKMLLMPLAIPAYIMAYAYYGFFYLLDASQLFFIDIRTLPGLIFVLSVSLYPYVYAMCVVAFRHQQASVLEAARTMGKKPLAVFFRVALPSARSALASGSALVLMELLNDYGAAKHYGVSTLTIGVFRAWFSMGDIVSAVRLCMLLIGLVVIFLLIERMFRADGWVDVATQSLRRCDRQRLRQWESIVAFTICLMPVLLGFLLPCAQILYWSVVAIRLEAIGELISTAFHSFQIAMVSALCCVAVAIILSFSKSWELNRTVGVFSRLSTLGYALPGAVVAIGILTIILAIGQYLPGYEALMNQTVIFLILAYAIRFVAVSFNAVETSFKKISPQTTAAARILSTSSLSALFRVHLPIAVPGVMTAILLVFVEVMKELPLTLILRPFNYNTLATRCFEMASDERMFDAGIYAAVIVSVSIVPVLWIYRLIKLADS